MDELTEAVRERYGKAARRVTGGGTGSCCGETSSEGCSPCADPITSGLYSESETQGLPDAAMKSSLGCGNPTALAELRAGETVLDLGSGGGLDVLLSARRVGPTGKAYGVDMTDEMLALAEENKRKSSVRNVEFLRGTIEDVPLPAGGVDVVLSNCAINLSGDKQRVLDEAFRVLKPGGRFAVSDVVVRGALPPALRRSMELWVGCIAGALTEEAYREKLARAGFTDVSVEVTRTYDVEDARTFLAAAGLDVDVVAADVKDKVVSAFIRARKPDACGGPAGCS
jgi:arsenite methyltransferase